MSGHSKWSTIKRKKGAKDAKRGILFTRIAKDITLAAKESGGDPDMNASLRLAIKKAKSANMPANNIDRALKKGTGELEGVQYESLIYEGYGPHGVALLLEVFTDNKKRTVSDIRHLLVKYDGNLGESGCVNWMFKKMGRIIIAKDNLNEDNLLEDILDLEIDDFDEQEDIIEIITPQETFNSIISTLEDKGYDIEGKIELIPQNLVTVKTNDLDSIIKLIDALEEHDDIQKVNSNIELSD